MGIGRSASSPQKTFVAMPSNRISPRDYRICGSYLTYANRIAKRCIIAVAVLAGVKIATAARQLGVSRSWASREANAPGTRLLIAQLLAPHRERLGVLFDQTLDVIEGAFQARKIFLVKGVVVDGRPDHYARLEAVKMFVQLLSSCR
jgi:hypothetical protein